MDNAKTPKYLMILEVSQKQNYIFGSKRLRDNVERSLRVREATESRFFEEKVKDPSVYCKANNLVYTGGGHTVLQFNDEGKAKEFAKRVTRAAIKEFDGIEVFVKTIEYNDKNTPGQNLNDLTAALEKKKLLRKNSCHRSSIGIEELSTENFWPVEVSNNNGSANKLPEDKPMTDGYKYACEFEDIAKIGDDNFIAVVHIDGNSMGARVAKVQDKYKDKKWEDCVEGMRNFSKSIQDSYEGAFKETKEEFIKKLNLVQGTLPIRPIILAGDDVCFVTTGKYGIEAARIFLEKLSQKINDEDEEDYAACAGVAIVHTKYPFHRAYELSEKLCSNAKKFGVSLDPNGGVSAMDWHIEFGQLKGGLSEIRDEYETEDGNRLELRPVTVIDNKKNPSDYRKYEFTRNLAAAMAREKKTIARSKLKDLRNAMKQGTVETDYYRKQKEISSLISQKFGISGFVFADIPVVGKNKPETRCLLFDALEISDHFELID